MSNTTTIRRAKVLTTDVFESPLDKLKQAEVSSLALSLQTTDVAVHVGFFDGGCFWEVDLDFCLM